MPFEPYESSSIWTRPMPAGTAIWVPSFSVLIDYRMRRRNFRRALDLDPRLARAWNGLGVVYARTGREEEAISAWQRTTEIDPDQFDTLYNLGTLLIRLNRFEEAIPHLEQFVRTAPRDRYGERSSQGPTAHCRAQSKRLVLSLPFGEGSRDLVSLPQPQPIVFFVPELGVDTSQNLIA